MSLSPELPNLDLEAFREPNLQRLLPAERATHAPRILLLYGSVRERSYSRLLTEEAARLLRKMGAEARIFDPRGLPLPDGAPEDHAKVKELRELAQWAEGMVWCSPERHGAMTGIMKAQIDWIPLSVGSVRPTQGKTLAVMEVSGGSQSAAIRAFLSAARGSNGGCGKTSCPVSCAHTRRTFTGSVACTTCGNRGSRSSSPWSTCSGGSPCGS